jgi:transposase
MEQKYRVRLSEEERAKLHEKKVEPNLPKTIRKRCDVLLLADENAGKPGTQEEIAKRSGVSEVTVSRLREQYATGGLEYCLRRQERENPPRARITSGEIEARLIALACGEPPEGYSRWSLRLLRDKVVELEIMESVSRETIRRVLKKRNFVLI